MPLKASECDAWYQDCKDDLFCTCIDEAECASFNTTGTPRSWFTMSDLECTADQCRTYGEIFANG